MRASEETYRARKQRRRLAICPRLALAAAALLLVAVYVLPIWKISLQAPQYPEGLGMYIEVDNIRGAAEGNLQSINGLNHYIGMKEIRPDSIPELKIMPWLFGALIVLGLAAAASGRAWALYAWVGLFTALAIAGLVDFYLWEYDYGHNLDQERAIIKVPGATYQPPLIGSKKMLNITAVSWPAAGGMIAMISLLIGVAAAALQLRLRFRKERVLSLAACVAAGALLAGCSTKPRPIAYGEDVCHHCKMIASDQRFGAEFVDGRGKVYVFDGIECLTAFLESEEGLEGGAYVTAMNDPGRLVAADAAFYARSPAIMSPMGAHLGAFDAAPARDEFLTAHEGEALSWGELAGAAGSAPARASFPAGAAQPAASPEDPSRGLVPAR